MPTYRMHIWPPARKWLLGKQMPPVTAQQYLALIEQLEEWGDELHNAGYEVIMEPVRMLILKAESQPRKAGISYVVTDEHRIHVMTPFAVGRTSDPRLRKNAVRFWRELRKSADY